MTMFLLLYMKVKIPGALFLAQFKNVEGIDHPLKKKDQPVAPVAGRYRRAGE